MEMILGIDLGTTNSAVSVIRDGEVVVLEEDGEKVLPSVVGLGPDGELLVGFPAQNQWTLAPDRTVRSVKRKMGSSESVCLGDQSYSPQEISAMILRTLKERAARVIGREVHKAVVTVPAFFNEQQREATREAGELAGLEVVRIVNEPTAASLTYNSNPDQCERLLVYDLGGGTFDVSIVQIEQGVVEVLASHGNTQLGGDDFDQLLMDHVCDQFQEEHDVDLRGALTSKSRVLKAVEEAKKQLSYDAFTGIELEFVAEKAGTPLHLKRELSRHEYEPLIEPLLNKTLVCVDEALSDAKLTAKQIDRVILVGGASRTPLVHQLLREQLAQPVHAEIDPDLCVSMGAAVQGGLVAGLDMGPVLVDITPHTLGVRCLGELNGFESPYEFARIIERNTALPASRSEVFQTACDDQKIALIDIFQGEDRDVRHNEPVGKFSLEGLADACRGNQIVVRFDLDLDGILTATATEKLTGLEKDLRIENAMSRFRGEQREEARGRVEAAFSGEASAVVETPRASACEVDGSLSGELKSAIDRTNDLLGKAEQLLDGANEQDAGEMRDLMGRIRKAVETRALDKINDLVGELDELVFYMQDAV